MWDNLIEFLSQDWVLTGKIFGWVFLTLVINFIAKKFAVKQITKTKILNPAFLQNLKCKILIDSAKKKRKSSCSDKKS